MSQDLFDFDLRVTVRPPPWEPPTDCIDWAQGEHGPLLVIAGAQDRRDTLYRQVKAVHVNPKETWCEGYFTGFLADRLSKLRSLGSIIPHEWDLIWNLVTVDEVHLDFTLQDFVDHGKLFTRLYHALMEIRKRLEDDTEVSSAVRAFGQWLAKGKVEALYDQTLLGLKDSGQMLVPYERFDACFFLATLATVNALLGPTILVVDGLEGILMNHHRKALAKELMDLCLSIDRWARLGCPIKFVLGFTEERSITHLGRVYAPLAHQLNSKLCTI